MMCIHPTNSSIIPQTGQASPRPAHRPSVMHEDLALTDSVPALLCKVLPLSLNQSHQDVCARQQCMQGIHAIKKIMLRHARGCNIQLHACRSWHGHLASCMSMSP